MRPGLAASQAAVPVSQRGGVDRSVRRHHETADRAPFLLMLCSGLRVGEVAKLSLKALDLTRGRALVLSSKGGKDRCRLARTPAGPWLGPGDGPGHRQAGWGGRAVAPLSKDYYNNAHSGASGFGRTGMAHTF